MVPAYVLIIPPGVTLRIRALPASAMYTFPAASTAMSAGVSSRAAVAAPPSPVRPAVPVPAKVVITPAAETLRTRWLPRSAM